MDIAIVTGAETPLGVRLIQGLIQQGCRVHGIGNNFSKVTFADPNFIAHPIDVSDLTALSETTKGILEKENRVDILIHAIDVTPGAAFEKLPIGNLEAILKIGLLGPVMLTRMVLPNLLRFRGQLINILPSNKSGQPASAANALIEGGLRSMNAALFDQARDAGLRVTNLILKQNSASPLNATPEVLSQSRIDPEHVARVVERLLDPNEPNVPSELVLYPRLSPEATEDLPPAIQPLDPYSAVVLPPQEYNPPEQPKIPTKERERIDRTIPYTDDEMEDKIAAAIEDFEAHPERYEAPAQPKQQAPQAPKDSGSSNSNQPDDGQPSKRRRGRRRGGRNRNRNRNQDDGPNQNPNHPQSDKPQASQQKEPKESAGSGQPQPDGKKPARRRRNNRNKPAPDGQPSKPSQPNEPNRARGPKPEVKPEHAAGIPVAKKPPTKKPAKKVATKKAVKKAAKKAVKKKATKKVATKKTARKVAKLKGDKAG